MKHLHRYRLVGESRSLAMSALAALAILLGATVSAEFGGGLSATPPAADPPIRWLTERTIVEVGSTRVICFEAAPVSRSEEASDEPEFLATLSDESVLEILRSPELAAGHKTGFIRVRGVRPGSTQLTIAGQSIQVRVAAPRDERSHARFAPHIVGPTDGASVWGTFGIGVELREPPGSPLRSIGVVLSTGQRLEVPKSDSGSRFPSHRQLLFSFDSVDATLLPKPRGLVNRLGLTPFATSQDGEEQHGITVWVNIVKPDLVIAGEAEAEYDVDRPRRFQNDRRRVGLDENASDGAYFENYSAQPALCFPLEIKKAGSYQVALRVRGSRGQGALPSVGIVINGENQPRTNGRLLGEDWHRIVVGLPLHFEAGDHVLTPFFLNDFYVPGRVDRNLAIDRVEVARVWPIPSPAGGPSAPTSRPKGATGSGRPTSRPSVSDSEEAPYETNDPGPIARGSTELELGERQVNVRIGLTRPLHGKVLSGLTEVAARCWWNELDKTRAPKVTLLVNGHSVAVQRSAAPTFWLDPSVLEPGENRIRLRAQLDLSSSRVSGSLTAFTPEQTVWWPVAAARDRPSDVREHHRFSIHEKRWDPAINSMLRAQRYPKERRCAVFSSAGELRLTLPEELTGPHQVLLEMLGEAFEGAPIARVELEVASEKTLIGEKSAGGSWGLRSLGDVDLPEGPKKLVVSFTNDHYVEGKGDRNLLLEAIVLSERWSEPDTAPPVVELAYPPDGLVASEADALIAVASDNRSLASAELLIDDVRTGFTVSLNRRPGSIVMPLLLRHLAPGEHSVAVRVRDMAGNSTLSEIRTIEVREPNATLSLTRYQRAIHLLRRFAFGPDSDELAAILTLGETAWLQDRLSRSLEDAGELAAFTSYFPYFPGRNNYEVPRRSIAHLITTPNPVRARFVLWVENHFSTWIGKVQGPRKWSEHVAFSRAGVSHFQTLLRISAESPAMLAYLDQQQSYAGRLNENYARELMELHTLGVHGGYSQADVTQLAHILTGWTASREGDGRGSGPNALAYTYRFDPRLSEAGPFHWLGHRLPEAPPERRHDRVSLVLEALAAHPSTARFVAKKLATHYLNHVPSAALIDDLAERFLESGGDLRALLLAIAEHPAFWARPTEPRVMPALDYALRLTRATGHHHPWQVGEFLQRSGRGLFDCATPDGYPEEDDLQTDSNAMLQRWKLAHNARWALGSVVPGAWRRPGERLAPETWADSIVDLIALRLTGRTLSVASHESALQVLRESEGNISARIRLAAVTVAQLPEANLK